MQYSTPHLCDQYGDSHHLQIVDPVYKSFGGHSKVQGIVHTVKVFEDNVLIRAALSETVTDGVLVVDGGGSHRCALLGSGLARQAADNGWKGILIYGCVRDTLELASMPIGIWALHPNPLKSGKKGHGDRDKLISFSGVNFRTGLYFYADEDGIIIADETLS
jgi:regulator of ribonuclease activity A